MIKTILRKFAVTSSLALLSLAARADLSTCQDIYVGHVWLNNSQGLMAARFLNSPQDAGGSYWVFFNTWSEDARKAALATLIAAKMAGQRVVVATGEPGGCSILTGQSIGVELYLSQN